MRNDARPLGGDASHQSPVVGHSPEPVDHRTTTGESRETSGGTNTPTANRDVDRDDPVMPPNDSTLNTKI